MDCEQVIRLLWTWLDRELEVEVSQEVEEHVRACLRCKEHADFERRLREIIQTCCKKDKAPAGLRARLLALLAESSHGGDALSGH
ncbi:MAG: mycothiol system anti-sigma-R factor [Armatimonadota bacterium]|nr:mycothiol system anti-sigma-R factor [Armatimonadota bacterium]MDR5703330.1 mycothiol system anti-sigma-R factor [Armatimonadota bacterium]MDR7433512.1 mycothiol system anti-sigma-R factor [Armatimonadota bacterium]